LIWASLLFDCFAVLSVVFFVFLDLGAAFFFGVAFFVDDFGVGVFFSAMPLFTNG
jgi:hypothetical protein